MKKRIKKLAAAYERNRRGGGAGKVPQPQSPTGRAPSEPEIQQIFPAIRPPAQKIVETDLAAIEARMLASFNMPEALVVMGNGTAQDAYTRAAARAFGVPYDQVTPEQRATAKDQYYRWAWGIKK